MEIDIQLYHTLSHFLIYLQYRFKDQLVYPIFLRLVIETRGIDKIPALGCKNLTRMHV